MGMLHESVEKDDTVSTKLFSLNNSIYVVSLIFPYSPRIIYSNIIEVSFHSHHKFRAECQKRQPMSLLQRTMVPFPAPTLGLS